MNEGAFNLTAAAAGGAHEADVVIVGAGPVGLFAVFQCGMLGMTCHVVDVLDHVGGQCAALYPEKPIYDIPGLPEASGQELTERLSAQAAPFAPVLHLDQQVMALEQGGEGAAPTWTLRTAAETELRASVVIIAAGVGAFQPKRPPLDSIGAFEGQPEGQGVHYAVRDPGAYRGKRVVIAGGGDSAVHWALALTDRGAKVYVVHRRDKFRAAPGNVGRMRALADDGLIELVVPGQLTGVDGDGGALRAVTVMHDAKPRTIPADALLPFYGMAQTLGPIADWGLGLERNRILTDPTTAATNHPGVFAIGDIAHYPNKLKLILTGFSEAAFAAHAAHGIVFPDKALHFEYSTTKGLPAG